MKSFLARNSRTYVILTSDSPGCDIVEVEEGAPLALWLLIYIILFVLFSCFDEFEKLLMAEFLQKSIPKSERGRSLNLLEDL